MEKLVANVNSDSSEVVANESETALGTEASSIEVRVQQMSVSNDSEYRYAAGILKEIKDFPE